MKLLIIVLILALTGCAQLMNGQLQPVVVKDVKNKILFTTCSGAVETWHTCNQKAENSCSNGYYPLDKFESVMGGRRELTFKCN